MTNPEPRLRSLNSRGMPRKKRSKNSRNGSPGPKGPRKPSSRITRLVLMLTTAGLTLSARSAKEAGGGAAAEDKLTKKLRAEIKPSSILAFFISSSLRQLIRFYRYLLGLDLLFLRKNYLQNAILKFG